MKKRGPDFDPYDTKEDIEKCLNCKMVRCINCLKMQRQRKAKKCTPKTIEKIIFLYENGLSSSQVAKIVGLSPGCCRRKMREYEMEVQKSV